MNKDLKDCDGVIEKKIQIYFTEDSGLYDINVKSESVDKILAKNGFLIIHDLCDDEFHCYNMNYVKHFHFPGGNKL